MKKTKLALAAIILLAAGTVYSQTTNPAPYCYPSFLVNYNMFNNIIVKGTTLSFGPLGNWSDTTIYLYYDSVVFPNFVTGDTASIGLNVYSVEDAEPCYFALWIDYNQDGIFDSTELVMQNSNTTMASLPTLGASASPILKTITVPLSAASGITRARLMRGDSSGYYTPYNPTYSLPACPDEGMYEIGCAYDFNITILGGITTATGKTGPVATAPEIYPNPASNYVNINGDLIGSSINITDELGKTMTNFEVSGNKIDVSSLAPGFYFIQIINGNGSCVQKLLVQR